MGLSRASRAREAHITCHDDEIDKIKPEATLVAAVSHAPTAPAHAALRLCTTAEGDSKMQWILMYTGH